MAHWYFRPCTENDVPALKAAHAVFPVVYEDEFFRCVCQSGTPFISLLAFSSGNLRDVAGFAVARVLPLDSACYNDRKSLQHLLRVEEQPDPKTKVLYLLTLGVQAPFRRQGLGSKLLAELLQSVDLSAVCAVMLHTATDNHAACQLYEKAGFLRMRKHIDFYSIPNLSKPRSLLDFQKQDAFMYARVLSGGDVIAPLRWQEAVALPTPPDGLSGFLWSLLWQCWPRWWCPQPAPAAATRPSDGRSAGGTDDDDAWDGAGAGSRLACGTAAHLDNQLNVYRWLFRPGRRKTVQASCDLAF